MIDKGRATVLRQAREFVSKRLAPADPPNDGRQTPTGGHPVFVAQHATATCCRSCLAKWHRIPRGRAMPDGEIDFVVSLIEAWLRRQDPWVEPEPASVARHRQATLFDCSAVDEPPAPHRRQSKGA